MQCKTGEHAHESYPYSRTVGPQGCKGSSTSPRLDRPVSENLPHMFFSALPQRFALLGKIGGFLAAGFDGRFGRGEHAHIIQL
jgi:hypothetical protein